MFGKISPHHYLLHVIVVIWGFSPIIGRAIEAEAFQLVWFRILFTIITLSIYFFIGKKNIRCSTKKITTLLGVGVVIAIHWYCFYNAIKVSNVSIALVGFSTGTIFTAIIEPIFYKRKIIFYEIFFGLVIIATIGMIMHEDMTTQHPRKLIEIGMPAHKAINFNLGILLGAIAALTSSLFTVWNGILVRTTTSNTITFYELSGGLISLTIFLLLTGGFNDSKSSFNVPNSSEIIIVTKSFFKLANWDYFFLSILAVIGTAFPFIASTNLLKKISPYTITLTVNLETVYGIILAAIIFKEHEQLTPLFYFATLIILFVIVVNAALKHYLEKRNRTSPI